ncbi:MAG TPA: T9SS type A sorting domain-containing protein [Prolixibacteraceae bacterium]|nr:T9SS type A sorting domain-containing protein [Prolixibacteraceae bacterium]
MKPPMLILLFILCSIITFGQEYSFPLYFEDAAGNKDTLIFGFDKSATFGIDENLGERNILGQEVDSTFCVFFTDAVTRDLSDCYLAEVKEPTYLSKKQYINIPGSFIEIGMVAENFPVTVKWDRDGFEDFDINQYAGCDHCRLVMTSYHPFNGYPDVLCCGANRPNDLIGFTDSSEMIFGEDYQFCQYKANIDKKPIHLLYVGPMDITVGVNERSVNQPTCWYNQKTESVSIQNIKRQAPFIFEMFNIMGTKVLQKRIDKDHTDQLVFNLSRFEKGMYIISIKGLKHDSRNTTFKIIKR